jgi:hypothetical protein
METKSFEQMWDELSAMLYPGKVIFTLEDRVRNEIVEVKPGSIRRLSASSPTGRPSKVGRWAFERVWGELETKGEARTSSHPPRIVYAIMAELPYVEYVPERKVIRLKDV